MTEPASPRRGDGWAGSDPSRPGPLDPAVAVAMLQRGQVLVEGGDWELAAVTFGRVVGSNDPNLHIAALLGLAEARYRMDDEPAALQAWISATQGPETPLTWRAWKALAGARVREGDLVGAARAYREADRRAPPSERAEIASRLGWLNKELGNEGAAQRQFGRARAGGMPRPVVTWTIMAVTIAIGLAGLVSTDIADLTLEYLALIKPAVADGELWRLVTVVLVHDTGSFLHLAFNMYALFIIGPIVETLYGRWRFVFLYVVCGAAGSTASYLFSPALVGVGASGAIFGLFGVLLVADRVHKPALTRTARSLTTQIGGLIVVNLAIGFVLPNIDNAAHIGGLVAGAWLGYLLVPQGATMLRSLWTAGADGRSPGQVAGERLVRLLGVAALLGAIAVLVLVVGPLDLGR